MVGTYLITLSEINSKLLGSFQKSAVINALGWLLVAILAIGGTGAWAWWYIEKKKYNKKITAFEIIGDYYWPNIKDTAKIVKIGKSGFEVLYLKKLKTWKLAYGGKVGKNDYYFFIDPIGYWHNAMMSAKISHIDKFKGLIPIITTNPTMRAQYTALEKQIDLLHGQKQSFWEKYGMWVLSIGYLLIIGVFAWLSFREVGQFLGSGNELAKQMTALADRMNELAVNLKTTQPSGLVR